VQVLGIAAEHSFSQIPFADSLHLPYPLLSDYPALKVIQRYTGLQPHPNNPNRMAGTADACSHRYAGHRPMAVAWGDERLLSQCTHFAEGAGDDGQAVEYGYNHYSGEHGRVQVGRESNVALDVSRAPSVFASLTAETHVLCD
jgi:hypothetical protein